jgi:hypothetical protein
VSTVTLDWTVRVTEDHHWVFTDDAEVQPEFQSIEEFAEVVVTLTGKGDDNDRLADVLVVLKRAEGGAGFDTLQNERVSSRRFGTPHVTPKQLAERLTGE